MEGVSLSDLPTFIPLLRGVHQLMEPTTQKIRIYVKWQKVQTKKICKIEKFLFSNKIALILRRDIKRIIMVLQ